MAKDTRFYSRHSYGNSGKSGHAQRQIRICPRSSSKTLTKRLPRLTGQHGWEQTISALVSSSPYLKLEDRRLWTSSMSVRKKLLGLGRSTSNWLACLPRRLKLSDHLSFDQALPYLESHEKVFCAEWWFWDDVVRGSSPLQAALRRLVADELTQHTDNQEACTVSFEMRKVSMIPSLCLW